VNWFWDTLWKWFGDHHYEEPPTPRDENAKGLGWRGDRRSDAGQDIKMKHENIKGLDDNGH
jgi:hypothetical protein